MDAAINTLEEIAQEAKICSHRTSHQLPETSRQQCRNVFKALFKFYMHDFEKAGGYEAPSINKLIRKVMRAVVRSVEEAQATIRFEQLKRAARQQGVSPDIPTKCSTEILPKKGKTRKRSAESPAGSAQKKRKVSAIRKPIRRTYATKTLTTMKKNTKEAELPKLKTVKRAESESPIVAMEKEGDSTSTDEDDDDDDDEKMHMETEVGRNFLLCQAATGNDSEGSDRSDGDAESESSETIPKSRSPSATTLPDEKRDSPPATTLPDEKRDSDSHPVVPKLAEVVDLEESGSLTGDRLASSVTLQYEKGNSDDPSAKLKDLGEPESSESMTRYRSVSSMTLRDDCEDSHEHLAKLELEGAAGSEGSESITRHRSTSSVTLRDDCADSHEHLVKLQLEGVAESHSSGSVTQHRAASSETLREEDEGSVIYLGSQTAPIIIED